MPRDLPAIRILPMSDKRRGFAGLTIEQVQERFFLRELTRCGGRWRYRSAGLNAPAGTVVLFQFKARIVASAVFQRDEKFDRPIGGSRGVLEFETASIRTFEPLDFAAMRRAWPGMRPLGHVKQRLNAAGYSSFKRRLKTVMSPAPFALK